MSTRLFTSFVIIFLLAGCVFMLLRFRKLQQQKAEAEELCVRMQNKAQEQLNTYQSNLETAISNSNLRLENRMIKDTLNNRIPLKNIFAKGQRQLLVCRFSQQHCESCVDATIQILQKQVNQIGAKNIVYFGNHRNNRIFKKTIPLYGIKGMRVYNTPGFSIPVEQAGYPYFFILDSNLQVSGIFVPNKGVPAVTVKYLEAVKKLF